MAGGWVLAGGELLRDCGVQFCWRYVVGLAAMGRGTFPPSSLEQHWWAAKSLLQTLPAQRCLCGGCYVTRGGQHQSKHLVMSGSAPVPEKGDDARKGWGRTLLPLGSLLGPCQSGQGKELQSRSVVGEHSLVPAGAPPCQGARLLLPRSPLLLSLGRAPSW